MEIKDSSSSPSPSYSGECNSEEAKPWQSYHTVFTNAKAGMEGVNKEKVQKVVYEMSKGSKYFENERKKENLVKEKIESMRLRSSMLSEGDIVYYQKMADRKIYELEAMRDLSRIWLHVDMDAFYASVETLSNESLKGKPMAVGGMSMISTANYEARKYGVRAAMPGFIGKKLCPELIFVPPDFKKYTYYSDLTRKVFQEYDFDFVAASLDEAYLDITDVCNERGVSGGQIAEEVRGRVFEDTGLTCSAGVAPNRLLAKICSDINKPNGKFVLTNDQLAVVTFVSSLPIRKISGIGKVTESILKDALGIKTCDQIINKAALLYALFSPCSADFFISVGLGIGGMNSLETRTRKSISHERTFSPTNYEASLFKYLGEIAKMLGDDMQKEGISGRTLTLKLKASSFEVRTRAISLQKYISSSEDIKQYASKLLKSELPISLRLIGLRMSCFKDDDVSSVLDHHQKTLNDFLRPIEDDDFVKESSYCVDRSLTFDEPDTGSSKMEENELIWVDDYRCSICGIEMPLDFVQERLEHSDFHFADMLQKEESSSNQIRVTPKDESAKHIGRKKPKLSNKVIPIDTFFPKSNKSSS